MIRQALLTILALGGSWIELDESPINASGCDNLWMAARNAAVGVMNINISNDDDDDDKSFAEYWNILAIVEKQAAEDKGRFDQN